MRLPLLPQRGPNGFGALHFACEYGHLPIVRLLLRSRAAPADRSDEGWTPLHRAALDGHAGVVSALLGANKDARTGEMRTRSYVRGRPLGKGGFAVVFSMQDPSTGESFAAKVVAKSTLEKDRARQKILTEIRIHRSVDNAHVVKFKKCFEDTNNVYILMELCSDKTLADVVKRRGRLTERECAPSVMYILYTVAVAAALCLPPPPLEPVPSAARSS